MQDKLILVHITVSFACLPWTVRKGAGAASEGAPKRKCSEQGVPAK